MAPESSIEEEMRQVGASIDRRFDAILHAIEAGFGRMDTRFEQVDRRFERIDKRLERIEARLDEHDAKLDALLKRSQNETE